MSRYANAEFNARYQTFAGVDIVQTTVGTMKLIPDTSACRSPSRAIRRSKKHPLPQKAEYTCLCVGSTIYMHPTAYAEMTAKLSGMMRRKIDEATRNVFFGGHP